MVIFIKVSFFSCKTYDVDTRIRLMQHAGLAWSVVRFGSIYFFSHLNLEMLHTFTWFVPPLFSLHYASFKVTLGTFISNQFSKN